MGVLRYGSLCYYRDDSSEEIELAMNDMNRPKSSKGFFRRSKKTALLVTAAVILTLIAALVIPWWPGSQGLVHFPSSGTITTVNVKAYWDESLVNETKEVSWGSIYLGSSNNVSFYLQSISNVEATFELSTGNWTFRNSRGAIVLGPIDKTSYMNLTWNYINMVVSPNETVQVTLTLVVSDSSDFVLFLVNNDVKNFSVDVGIRAIER
jgi:hypothetical protein